jgi:hypothetical protein
MELEVNPRLREQVEHRRHREERTEWQLGAAE